MEKGKLHLSVVSEKHGLRNSNYGESKMKGKIT